MIPANHWSGAELKGCLFHFNQAILRWACRNGYNMAYSINTYFNAWLKMILSLPVIPVHCDIDAWTIIKNKLQSDLNVQPIINHFNSVWINGNFDINLWNTFGSDGPRANNFVESFNKNINIKLCSAHPNIWKFIDLI